MPHAHNKNRTIPKEGKSSKYLKILQYFAIGSIVVATIIGYLVYLGNKKREYGKSFEFYKFMFGNPICNHKTPPIKSYLKEIQYAFK